MFNYRNLDDVEFEELCKDVMEKKLNTKLRTFRKGVDGGIDLKDNDSENNIVVQVKHYINSTFSDLKTSLKKEVDKVEKLNPKKYYICCSQELKASNIKEIYQLFKNYMETEKNIITLKEIDDFLNEEKNKDVVRKHFKLWLYSTNILSEINNQNIFIECESLLNDIEEECKYYVKTTTYDVALKVLEERGSLILIGSPGVGKTTISKMLILYYSTLGYKVRYTTNGDISDIKKALSIDKDTNEIILLDDCLGQYYFKMKDTQENELVSIIKYINSNKNKKIILNSRITILNEAKQRSQELEKIINNKKINIYVMDMDKTSILEKARIFYNHLYFNNVGSEYYNSIKDNKNYFKIIKHRNYNPRIIETVTQSERYKDIKASEYYEFILSYLDNPVEVWKNEYERKISKIDRIFMLTLFSLTDTTVIENVIEQCFNKRLMEYNIDTTVNNFTDTLSRLNKSMIKIIDNNGKKEISVLNPSINDYLKSIFFENRLELEKIRESIMFFNQIERCYPKDKIEEIIKEKIESDKFLCLKINKMINSHNIETLLVHYIGQWEILNNIYIKFMQKYIENIKNGILKEDEAIGKYYIINYFFEEPLFSFYVVNKYITEEGFLINLFSNIELEDLVLGINNIQNRFNYSENVNCTYDFNNIAINSIKQGIKSYIDEFDIDNFIEDLDLNQYYYNDDYGIGQINEKQIYSDFEEVVRDQLDENIENLEDKSIKTIINEYINNINFNEYNWKSYVDKGIQLKQESNYDDYYDDEYDRYREDSILGENDILGEDNEIINIFNRDF